MNTTTKLPMLGQDTTEETEHVCILESLWKRQHITREDTKLFEFFGSLHSETLRWY